MTTDPRSLPRAPDHREGRIEQVIVTHCTKEESITGAAEFGVRATSTDRPSVLTFAMGFPARFKVSNEFAARFPEWTEAPRRLSLTPFDDNGTRPWALIHTVYQPRDTSFHKRPGNFLSHILMLPGPLSPATALQSWDATDWVVDPKNVASQQLSALAEVPSADCISDSALTDLLAGKPGSEQQLARVIAPRRIEATPGGPRAWLVETILAFIGDRRLTIRAEPGLVALLLYGLTRLLPTTLTRNLSFSTYELDLRGVSKEWNVVGTTEPLSGPDQVMVTERGQLLDTHGSTRPTATASGHSGAEYLVNLAREGRWDRINALHKLWDEAEITSADRGPLIDLAPALDRLEQGQVDDADLKVLQGSPFARLARAHLAPIRQALVQRLGRSSLSDPSCQPLWNTIARCLEPEQVAAEFKGILDRVIAGTRSRPLEFNARMELIACWTKLANSGTVLPERLMPFLAIATPDQARLLLALRLPERQVGQVIAEALTISASGNPALAAAILDPEKSDDLLRALVAHLRTREKTADVLGRLAGFAQPGRNQDLLRRLSQMGLVPAAADLEAILHNLAATGPDWDGFWVEVFNPQQPFDIMRELDPSGPFLRALAERHGASIDFQGAWKGAGQASSDFLDALSRWLGPERSTGGPVGEIITRNRAVRELMGHFSGHCLTREAYLNQTRQLGLKWDEPILAAFDHIERSGESPYSPKSVVVHFLRGVRACFNTDTEAEVHWRDLLKQHIPSPDPRDRATIWWQALNQRIEADQSSPLDAFREEEQELVTARIAEKAQPKRKGREAKPALPRISGRKNSYGHESIMLASLCALVVIVVAGILAVFIWSFGKKPADGLPPGPASAASVGEQPPGPGASKPVPGAR